jgi:hypothetical protein
MAGARSTDGEPNLRTAEPSHRRTAGAASAASATLWCLAVLVVACGKKGPPLPPLNLVPDRPLETSGRVAGDTVYLSLTVPAKNANGRGAVALDHLEVYAVTVDAGATPPPNRDLLTNAHVIAKIPIKPPVDPDAEEDESAPEDTRPGPGTPIVVAEPLTDDTKTPQIKATPAANASDANASANAAATSPQSGGQAAAPGAASVPTVPPLTSPESVSATGGGGGVAGVPPALPAIPATEPDEPPEGTPSSAAPGSTQTSPMATGGALPAAQVLKPSPTVTRVYAVRGINRKGRPGSPSARIVVPIVPSPAAPSNVTAEFGERSVTIKWAAPEPGTEPHPPLKYNVYAYDAKHQETATTVGLASTQAPVNPQPVDALAIEHEGAEPGKEQCFDVTTVETIGAVTVESEPSAPVCVTPVDRFAPAAPTGLAAVATTGAVNLIWDANPEPDVAGYVVLRGESPGDTLQPLTPEPIRETRFRDTTAQPGVRYAYAIVAIDRAGNRSTPSARVEETAR